MKNEKIEYNPTPENISLTDEQNALLEKALRHIHSAETTVKQTIRWQFWFKRIYDMGRKEGLKQASEHCLESECLLPIEDFMRTKQHLGACVARRLSKEILEIG